MKLVDDDKPSLWELIFGRLVKPSTEDDLELFAVMSLTDEEADEFDAFLNKIEKSDHWKSLNPEQRKQYAFNFPDLFEEYKKNKI